MANACCEKSENWEHVADLGHAEGFEFDLGKCKSCGCDIVNVYCVATQTSGQTPVSDLFISKVRSLKPGPERKEFMREWFSKELL